MAASEEWHSSVQADVRQLEANISETRSAMKRESVLLDVLNQKVDALQSDSPRKATQQNLNASMQSLTGTGNDTLMQSNKSNHAFDLADKLEAEQLERKTVIASMKVDIE